MYSTFTILLAHCSPRPLIIADTLHRSALEAFERRCNEQGIRLNIADLDHHTGAELFRSPGIIVYIGGAPELPHEPSHEPSPHVQRGSEIHRRNGINRNHEQIERLLETYGPAARHVFAYLPRNRVPDTAAARIEQLLMHMPEVQCTIELVEPAIDAIAARLRNQLHELAHSLPTSDADSSPAQPLRALHDGIAEDYCIGHIATPGLFEQLNAMMAAGAVPIVVTGGTRVGKSTLLAAWSREYASRHPDAILIRHFIEADGDSADHGLLLHHLLSELKDRGLITGMLPATPAGMQEKFLDALAALHGRGAVIVIDALDQLGTADQNLHWLPHNPHGVRLVVSATPGTAVQEARRRGWRELTIRELPPDVHRENVRQFLETNGIGGGENMMEFDLSESYRAPRETPARQQHITAGNMPVDDDDARIGATVSAALAQSADVPAGHLVERVGPGPARRLLALLWGSRRGLSAAEIRGLMDIEPIELTRLLESVRLLTTRHGTLVTLEHSTTRAAVERGIVNATGAGRAVHADLAAYFGAHAHGERRAEEAPWQWARAQAWPELQHCLEDISIFGTLVRAGRGFELFEYWRLLGRIGEMPGVYQDAVDRMLAVEDADGNGFAERIGLLELLGRFLCSCGAYNTSIQCLQRAVELRRERDDDDSLGLALARAALGEALRLGGRYNQALEYLKPALEQLRALPGADRTATAQAANDLGLTLRELGDDSALGYLNEALRLKQDYLGATHPSTAETLNDLALVHLDRQNYRTALARLREAVAIVSPGFSEDGPEIESPALATYLGNLAAARGKLPSRAHPERPSASALVLGMQALDIRDRMLGPTHHYTLVSRINMAVMQFRRNQLDDARGLCEDALRHMEGALEADHPHVLVATVNLAQLLQSFGELDSALNLLLTALPLCRTRVPKGHWLTATCLQNLAGLLRTMKRHREAGRYAVDAIAERRAARVPDPAGLASLLIMHAGLLVKLGSETEAAAVFSEAIAIRESTLGPADGRTLEALGFLITALHRLRQHAEADAKLMLYEQRVTMLQAAFGEHDARAIEARRRLDALREAIGGNPDTGALKKQPTKRGATAKPRR